MSTQNAIEVRSVSKSFKRVFDKPKSVKESLIFWNRRKSEYHQVLNGVTLDIKKGETVCLIGTNGSGKSTLLKLMTKILYPNTGSIKTFGKLVSLLELGAGFHPDFTGRENIYFNASIFGLTRQEIEARLDEVISFSELGGFIDNPVRTYSSGMYMRLAFSVAINVDADILLIDEILAVGDQHFQDKCLNKLHELRDSDKTIVIVSHSMDVLKELCSRAIWIYKGDVAGDGTPDEIIPKYLKQSDDDYRALALDENNGELAGILHIDEPITGSEFPQMLEKLRIRGWELSNIEDSCVNIYINDECLGTAARTQRMDVTLAYQGLYGGMSTNKTPGWFFDLDITKYNGEIEITVSTQSLNGDEISNSKINVNIN